MKRLPIKPKQIGIFLGLSVLVVLVMDFNNRLELLSQLSTQVATVRVEGTAIAQTQLALHTQIAYATSINALIDYTDDNGLAKPGEHKVQPVQIGTPTPTPFPLPPPPSPRPSNWQIWWKLFFGD
jgi:hypothetical protein